MQFDVVDRRDYELSQMNFGKVGEPYCHPDSFNENIEKSLRRMSVNSLDLLQFHWWDYKNPYYMDALKYLSDLRDKGRIKDLGLTNFDTERVQMMIDSKLQIGLPAQPGTKSSRRLVSPILFVHVRRCSTS